jgi:hypothetical protein
MAKTISVQVSKDSLKHLAALAKSSGLSKDKALEWVLMETAAPIVSKRGKEQRTEDLSARLPDAAHAIMASVAARYKVSDGMIVEAYLSRTY